MKYASFNFYRGVRLCSTIIALLVLASCVGRQTVPGSIGRKDDSALFFEYLFKGDSVYALKNSYQSFVGSLKYYDSAQLVADKFQDTLMLAEAVFAKGRVYDAWNKEPQQTINYFRKAADIFAQIPSQSVRYLYVKHLVAHAYDKIKDSSNAVKVLQEMYREILPKDSNARKNLPFTAEMALISTEVGNYQLADAILRNLTKRAWIENDPYTYDFLNHYFLTESRLDVYLRKPNHSYYLDSLKQVFKTSSNVFDRMFYSNALSVLYAANGNYQEGYYYLNQSHVFADSLDNKGAVESMQTALLRSELLAEKRKLEYQAAIRENRLRLIWVLSVLLGVITILSIYLYRKRNKYQVQSMSLSTVNKKLDDKVAQVELLNKEIQHRVKNNLHMIFSLLQMQERKTGNEEALENLQAARMRVENIAALHNQLLNSKGSLDFASHIKGIISSVVNCLSDDKKVVTHIATDEINIPDNGYFALSLILNEWVTNSIKYAFTDNNLIEVNVSIRNLPGGICIEYYDNGTMNSYKNGNSNNASSEAGLGTQIITLLSRQMNATLNTINNNPFHYQLCIPHGS